MTAARRPPLLAATTLVGLAALAALAGPAHADPKAAAARPAPAGVIRGEIRFEGEPPPRPLLRRDTDPYCEKLPRASEDVVVTRGRLKDVLVRIAPGTLGAHPTPTTPVVIDQQGCMYTPRVVGVMPGQPLVVKNSDGTFHNVHGTLAGKHLFNHPHPPAAPALALTAAGASGDVIDVVCDVHPWMHAYAVVTDHPVFAVTGEDGAFALTGLAPGTYTVEAWHPTLGTRTAKVKVGTGKKAKVTARLTYKAG